MDVGSCEDDREAGECANNRGKTRAKRKEWVRRRPHQTMTNYSCSKCDYFHGKTEKQKNFWIFQRNSACVTVENQEEQISQILKHTAAQNLPFDQWIWCLHVQITQVHLMFSKWRMMWLTDKLLLERFTSKLWLLWLDKSWNTQCYMIMMWYMKHVEICYKKTTFQGNSGIFNPWLLITMRQATIHCRPSQSCLTEMVDNEWWSTMRCEAVCTRAGCVCVCVCSN